MITLLYAQVMSRLKISIHCNCPQFKASALMRGSSGHHACVQGGHTNDDNNMMTSLHNINNLTDEVYYGINTGN